MDTNGTIPFEDALRVQHVHLSLARMAAQVELECKSVQDPAAKVLLEKTVKLFDGLSLSYSEYVKVVRENQPALTPAPKPST